jgi:sulfate permease, SulP family
VVIVAQSAATSRSFAQKHDESFDENRDLVGLAVANALAGLSSSFVVNGSPTKTAVVDAAGGRTQVAQLTTAVVTLLVVLFATGLIAHLPNAALAAIVFLIGARLIDLRSLRNIFRFRMATFAVAVATLLAVVFLGVERGIFLAIGLSILDHLQREYHPKDVVLSSSQGRWQARRAAPGLQSAPGLLIYRFQAPLFFANADYFAHRLQTLVRGAPSPVRRLVLDLVSVDDVDYSAGLVLLATLTRLQQDGVAIALAQAEDVRPALDRLGITARIGAGRIYASVQEAVDAFRDDQAPAPVTTAGPP